VKQSYGAELIAMDTATVSAAGPAPSAVPLNPFPQPPDTKLAMALQISGHVIFQENDAILDQLLGQKTDSEHDLRPTT
jgi:hypothetical protein